MHNWLRQPVPRPPVPLFILVVGIGVLIGGWALDQPEALAVGGGLWAWGATWQFLMALLRPSEGRRRFWRAVIGLAIGALGFALGYLLSATVG